MTEMNRTSGNYCYDLVKAILELGREAKNRASQGDEAFEKGRQMAFYEVLSLMKQQAIAFDIDEATLGLKGMDIEKEVLL